MDSMVRNLVFGVLTLIILFGCAFFPDPDGEGIDSLQEFKDVLTRFYKAEKSQDWKTYWSYFNSATKEEMPYSEFVEYMEDVPNLSSYKILSVKNYGPDKDNPDRLKATVEVLVEKTVKESARHYGINQSIDFWWHLDGKWVWVIRK